MQRMTEKASGRRFTKWLSGSAIVLSIVVIVLIFKRQVVDVWAWMTEYRKPEWWGAAGQWAGALGAFAAALVALWIAIRDGRLTRREMTDRSEREHRDHVSRLSAWPSRSEDVLDDVFPMKVLNSSTEQFYNIVVFPVFIQGTGSRTGEEHLQDGEPEYGSNRCAVMGALPPGKWEISARMDTGILQGRPGVEIAATDRFGVHWIRRATGKIEEIPMNPIEFYGLERPYQYQIPAEVTP